MDYEDNNLEERNCEKRSLLVGDMEDIIPTVNNEHAGEDVIPRTTTTTASSSSDCADVVDGNEYRALKEKFESMQMMADEKMKLLEKQLEEKFVARIENAQNEMRALIGDEKRQTDEKFDRMEKAHEEVKSLVENQAGDEPIAVASRRAVFSSNRIASMVFNNSSEEGADGISLVEDTFSLMMVTKVCSQSWILGLVSS